MLNNIKMIVTDLDGTFLNENREVSVANRETILKLKKQDYIICIASGRPYVNVYNLADSIFDDFHNVYLITNTGANVDDLELNKNISSNNLSTANYNEIKSYLKNSNVEFVGYTENELCSFTNVFNDAMKHDQAILQMPLLKVNIEEYDNKICRYNIMGTKKDIDEAIKKIPMNILNKYYYVRNESFSFEILNKNSGKANALIALANYLNLNLDDQVITIGDNYNDLEMLKVTKHSVCMGQSDDTIKNACKYVTKSNINDGFTFIIHELLFK